MSLLLAMALASAQAETPPHENLVEDMHVVGQCLAQNQEERVRSVLALDYRSNEYRDQLWKLMRDRNVCNALIRFDIHSAGLLVAGSLAEGMLRQDAVLGRVVEATQHRTDLPEIEARDEGELIAMCVVRASPAGVAALLDTRPATQDELAAFKPLGPALSGCVRAGSTSEFSRESLRALIALGTWRLATYNLQAKS
ncbi:MAG TPA: hypothetical protein VM531_10400 [Sphingomicrobium sp.]|nr:hypothetical protein [Sphingomicrobium sp.]